MAFLNDNFTPLLAECVEQAEARSPKLAGMFFIGIETRNPARAELERQHGYDTKHAMHLIRLMRMGLEVLETGDLRVRRDDADELSAIRDGAMSFDALLAAATGLQDSMEKAAATTRLPADVDREGVDDLLLALLREGSP